MMGLLGNMNLNDALRIMGGSPSAPNNMTPGMGVKPELPSPLPTAPAQTFPQLGLGGSPMPMNMSPVDLAATARDQSKPVNTPTQQLSLQPWQSPTQTAAMQRPRPRPRFRMGR